jgi:hypothetical protein
MRSAVELMDASVSKNASKTPALLNGGNRDMCSWRMIGYPGARYDYRDWVHRHNERYPRPPVSIEGRADWNAQKI